MTHILGKNRLKVRSFIENTFSTKIQNATLPGIALVTLGLDGSGEGKWFVQSGSLVEEEQVIGEGPFGPVHAPIPGRIARITTMKTPKGADTVIAGISLEGEFKRTGKTHAERRWEEENPQKLWEEIYKLGYVYTPSSLEKPRFLPPLGSIKQLIINCLQAEPYQNGYFHLSQEYPDKLFRAVRMIKKFYSPQRIVFAVHKHPENYTRKFQANFGTGTTETQFFNMDYPSAHSSFLSKDEFSTLVIDPESLLYLEEAVLLRRPQIETFITISGSGIGTPGVYRARVGTPVSQLLKEASAVIPKNGVVVLGGPFRGAQVEGDFPVTRSTRVLLVLAPHEVRSAPVSECIRCGSCVDYCPVGINPIRLSEAITRNNPSAELESELNRCIECGICSAVCPSRIPLLANFQTARITGLVKTKE